MGDAQPVHTAAWQRTCAGGAVTQYDHRCHLLTQVCHALQRMYKEVQRALRSLFVRPLGGGGGSESAAPPEWLLQHAPLGQRSAVRPVDLPAALSGTAFGGDGSGSTDGGGGGGSRSSLTGAAADERPAKVRPAALCTTADAASEMS